MWRDLLGEQSQNLEIFQSVRNRWSQTICCPSGTSHPSPSITQHWNTGDDVALSTLCGQKYWDNSFSPITRRHFQTFVKEWVLLENLHVTVTACHHGNKWTEESCKTCSYRTGLLSVRWTVHQNHQSFHHQRTRPSSSVRVWCHKCFFTNGTKLQDIVRTPALSLDMQLYNKWVDSLHTYQGQYWD